MTRRSFLRRAQLAAAVGAGGLLIPGCAEPSSAGGGAEGGDPITFATILPLETLAYTLELTATAGGYFEREGLSVSFQSTRGSAPAIQILAARSAPLTTLGLIETMTAAGEQDIPLQMIAMINRGSGIRFISSEAHPLRRAEDFVGQTMGIPSEGGTSETLLDLVLANGGIPLDQVGRQVVGLTPGTYNLVQQGRIAGYIVSLDTSVILQQQHDDAVIFDPGTVVASERYGYVSSRPLIERNGDILRRYMSAIYATMTDIIADADANFDTTLETMRSQYSFNVLDDDEVARDSLRGYVDLWTGGGERPEILQITSEEWQTSYQELVDTDNLPADLPADDWYTNELLPQA